MQLSDYLARLADPHTPPPDTLELPPLLAQQMFELYRVAEQHGRERGAPLIHAADTFALGQVGEGQPESMTIPKTGHPGNYGDVHAHPSGSIGHTGGHSAHSMQDLLNFQNTKDPDGKETKPYWFQFVVAGPWLYAMVQIAGVSKWPGARTVAKFLDARSGIELEQMTLLLEKLAGGEEEWKRRKDQVAQVGVQATYDAFLVKSKNDAGIGPLMQKLSVKHCIEFAREYQFLFYAGQGTTLIRSA